MVDYVLADYAFNLQYARMLTADIPDEQMCEQSGGMANHPAWLIGHLASTGDFLATQLGKEPSLDPAWKIPFGHDTTPAFDRDAYPSKEELIQTLDQQHARVSQIVKELDPSVLAQKTESKEISSIFPTKGNLVVYVLTSHEATHLGQLSAWRSGKGMGRVF